MSGSTDNESTQGSLQRELLASSVQQKNDIYHAALTVFNLLGGFPDEEKGPKGFYHFLWKKGVSAAAVEFVVRLGDQNQSEIITAQQALQDEWFSADQTSFQHDSAE